MWCSSQNTFPKLTNDSLIVITPQQLKATNLIFLEHEKLRLQVPRLDTIILTYEEMIKSYERSIQLQNTKVIELSSYAEEANRTINSQTDRINKLDRKVRVFRGLTIGGVSVSVLLLTLLLVK